jgi:hypothetical protein
VKPARDPCFSRRILNDRRGRIVGDPESEPIWSYFRVGTKELPDFERICTPRLVTRDCALTEKTNKSCAIRLHPTP